MNRNIPERFDKDKIYYTKIIGCEELTLFIYEYRKGVWTFRLFNEGEPTSMYVGNTPEVIINKNECFITKEEYDDLIFLDESKR